MRSLAVPCAYSTCARTTTDPSRRCPWHRSGKRALAERPLLPMVAPASLREVDSGVNAERVRHLDPSGALHCEDGPAQVLKDRRGMLLAEEWWVHGVKHRVGAPALREYTSSGGLDREIYYDRDEISRLDGPAVVNRRPAFSSDDHQWWFDGEHCRSVDGLADAILLAPEEKLRESIENSVYAPLLDEGRDVFAIGAGIATGLRGDTRTLDGVRAILDGAPVEWARAFEEGQS